MSSFDREPNWYAARAWHMRHCPGSLRSWLLDQQSLTKRLIETANGEFQVVVLHQGWERPQHSERAALGLRYQDFAFSRHVILRGHGQPWVYARTVIPHATLHGPLRSLTRLGNKPLGAILFSNPAIARENLQIARLSPGQGMYNAATQQLTVDDDIWGRRSVFRFHQHALLVSELFLPALPHQ